MSPKEFKERNWNRLLTEIEKGLVVPIVGPELAVIQVAGQTATFTAHLAHQLAGRLEVDLPPGGGDISDVVYLHGQRPGSDQLEPYYEVWDLVKRFDGRIPEPLRQLAAIEPLQIFVTTAFDDLIERALDEVRFGGEKRTLSFSFPKRGTAPDLPRSLDAPVVYHVFGTANTLPTYVLTEEDLLEFAHLWQDRDRRPPRLASTLRDKHFMMLGCSFENWLSRFFLCAIKADALFEVKQALRGIVADQHSREDNELSLFLTRCNTQLYSQGGAVEFVADLSKRWGAHTRAPLQQSRAGTEEQEPECTPGAFFISYASEDRWAATALRTALEEAGMDVWMDERQLESGDEYESKIRRNIERCCFFIPIISSHVLTHERRFFRLEWSHAIAEAKFRPSDRPFVLPVVVDETRENCEALPDEFRRVQWSRYEGESPSREFIELCRSRIRALRRARLEVTA